MNTLNKVLTFVLSALIFCICLFMVTPANAKNAESTNTRKIVLEVSNLIKPQNLICFDATKPVYIGTSKEYNTRTYSYKVLNPLPSDGPTVLAVTIPVGSIAKNGAGLVVCNQQMNLRGDGLEEIFTGGC